MRRRRAGAAVLGGGASRDGGVRRSLASLGASDVEQMFSRAMLSRLSCHCRTQSCRRPSLQLSQPAGHGNGQRTAKTSTSMESNYLGRTRSKLQAAFTAHPS